MRFQNIRELFSSTAGGPLRRRRGVVVLVALAMILGLGPFIAWEVNAGGDEGPFTQEPGLIEIEDLPDRLPVYGPQGQILRYVDTEAYFKALENKPVLPADAADDIEVPEGGPDEIQVESNVEDPGPG